MHHKCINVCVCYSIDFHLLTKFKKKSKIFVLIMLHVELFSSFFVENGVCSDDTSMFPFLFKHEI